MAYEEAKVNNIDRVIKMESGKEISFKDKILAMGSAGKAEPTIINFSNCDDCASKFGMEFGMSVFDVCCNVERYYYLTLKEAKRLSGKLSECIIKKEWIDGNIVILHGQKYRLTKVCD